MRTRSSAIPAAEPVEKLIRSCVGLRVRSSDPVALQRWIAGRMQAQGMTCPDAYESLLQQKSPMGHHEKIVNRR